MKIRKKTFESRGAQMKHQITLPCSLSVLSVLQACCSADCVVFASRVRNSGILFRRREKEQSPAAAAADACWSTLVRKHFSPVFSFQHSLHSNIQAGWRILSPAPTIRKQIVL